MLVASAANAATVYEKDGQKFDVYGRAQVNVYNDSAAGSDSNTLEGYGVFSMNFLLTFRTYAIPMEKQTDCATCRK